MTDLNCYITTFNCGRTLVDVDIFAANLFDGLKTGLPPDLVVLALQEIAPIGYSFLGGSSLRPYLTRFESAVNVAASQKFGDGNEYQNVITRDVGMTGIMIFATSKLRQDIRWIEVAGVGVGLMAMGNKGAVGVRLALSADGSDEMMVTFVGAHLAPMEWDWKRRNADWRAICEGLVFQRQHASRPPKAVDSPTGTGSEAEPLISSADEDSSDRGHSLFEPVSHIFFAGDLNYRTSDTAPDEDDHKSWPTPTSDVQQWSHMLGKDQLTRELHADRTLHKLAESEITFPPTYKYSAAAQKQAAHLKDTKPTASEDAAGPWARHRVPSWCDRIVYLAAAPPSVHSYVALPVQPTSDHRPVAMSFSIPRKPLPPSMADVKPPFPIREDWKEARAAARQYEYLVGLAAYLSLTWEGEALLAGTVCGILGGYLVLRAMLGS